MKERTHRDKAVLVKRQGRPYGRKNINLSIAMPIPLAEQLTARANKMYVTRSSIAVAAIQKYLEEMPNEN